MDDNALDVSSNPLANELKNNLQELKASKIAEKGTDKIASDSVKEPIKEVIEEPKIKKSTFRKGDQSLDLDEDYEIEMTADKKQVKMSLRELKERAAGDIAVKNRMHSLAEEKKKVMATIKEFASIAKKDPLAALEYISGKATDADSEFEYKKYLSALAEQAERLGKMDEKELKSYELEKKLEKVEKDLSQKEKMDSVLSRKQEMLSEFPEIGDQQFGEMVERVLENPELSEGIEDEHELLDVVDSLIRETLTQRDIITVINEINPEYSRDNELIFSISDQIKKNPDLDEEDIRDIIREVIRPNERAKASMVLSQKQRSSSSVQNLRSQNMSNFELLKEQLLEQRTKRV